MPQRTAIIGAVGSVLLAGGLAAAVTAAARPGGPPDLGGVIEVAPPRTATTAPSRPSPAVTSPSAVPDSARAVTPPRPPGSDDADDG